MAQSQSCSVDEPTFFGEYGPGFPIDGGSVEIIQEPIEFFNALKAGVKNAKRRVVLATLYIGTGDREKELVDTLQQALTSNPDLRALILVDGCRGSRGSSNTRTVLSPVLRAVNHGNGDAGVVGDGDGQLHVSLYQTPELPSWIRWMVPHKYNEVVSVQHMKLYVFDDDVLLSGANLSADYFHQRQDRAVLIRNAPLFADYLCSVASVTAAHSFRLAADNTMSFSPCASQALSHLSTTTRDGGADVADDGNAIPDPLAFGNRRSFYASLRRMFQALGRQSARSDAGFFGARPTRSLGSASDSTPGVATHSGRGEANVCDLNAARSKESTPDESSCSVGSSGGDAGGRSSRAASHGAIGANDGASTSRSRDDERSTDTIIYPLLQLGLADVVEDEKATRRLLHFSSSHAFNLRLASGYFNLTPEYSEALLQRSKKGRASTEILLASPVANGFLGAPGPRGSIPAGYVHRCKLFYDTVQRECGTNADAGIRLSEYFRDGWTFHSKGLWLYPPNCAEPNVTLIGSPNFGYRSTCRDLELQVAMVTRNAALKKKLREEADDLFSHGSPVTDGTFQRPDHYVPWLVAAIANLAKKLV